MMPLGLETDGRNSSFVVPTVRGKELAKIWAIDLEEEEEEALESGF